MTNGIASIAGQGIALIEMGSLRDALDAAYRSPQGVEATVTAQRVFDRLTSSSWPKEVICRFLSGWRSTHGTSLFVSGLIIRMLRAAKQAGEPARAILYRAAGEIGEIIPEDTGVTDIPHNELFARFANCVVGDDRWRTDRYSVPACERFRRYVKEQRLGAPLEEAILTTAASENWNAGEYTYFDALVWRWMSEILGHAPEETEESIAYVRVHAGKTELGHFLHAMRAWKLYCEATDRSADPMIARLAFENYLQGVGTAFTSLEHILMDADERPSKRRERPS